MIARAIDNKSKNSKGNSRMKRQPIKWGKALTNYVSDKEIIFKIYRQFQKLNSNIKYSKFLMS